MAGFGIRLARSQGMEGSSGNLNEFLIDPADTNSIFTGDVVTLSGGYVQEITGNTDGVHTPVAGADPVGIFMGCRYIDTDGSYTFRNHWDGNSGRSNIIAHVAMPAHQMYHAKLNAPGTVADVGTRRALVYAAGSTAYGDSRALLGASAATGYYLIHRLAPLPNNNWTDAEPIVEVSPVVQQGMALNATA